jgi:hypothetical protein
MATQQPARRGAVVDHVCQAVVDHVCQAVVDHAAILVGSPIRILHIEVERIPETVG